MQQPVERASDPGVLREAGWRERGGTDSGLGHHVNVIPLKCAASHSSKLEIYLQRTPHTTPNQTMVVLVILRKPCNVVLSLRADTMVAAEPVAPYGPR